MKNFKEKIDRILFENKMTKENLVSRIGKTRQWLNNCETSNKLWVEDLEKISQVGKVPMSYWFDEHDKIIYDEISEQYGEPTAQIINRLNRQIDVFLEQISEYKEREKEFIQNIELLKANSAPEIEKLKQKIVDLQKEINNLKEDN